MENTEIKHAFELVTPEIAKTMDREGLIDWLCWENPEECYKDSDSLNKFGNKLTRQDALALVLRALRKIKHGS